jgi:hypothetical protein
MVVCHVKLFIKLSLKFSCSMHYLHFTNTKRKKYYNPVYRLYCIRNHIRHVFFNVFLCLYVFLYLRTESFCLYVFLSSALLCVCLLLRTTLSVCLPVCLPSCSCTVSSVSLPAFLPSRPSADYYLVVYFLACQSSCLSSCLYFHPAF